MSGGIVYEDGKKWEISETVELALKCLGVGYGWIRPPHAAVLITYGLAYANPPNGYRITPSGKQALELWAGGHEYHCGTPDGRPPTEARGPQNRER